MESSSTPSFPTSSTSPASPSLPSLPQALFCRNCHHTWMPRKDALPSRCPGCQSLKWNTLPGGPTEQVADDQGGVMEVVQGISGIDLNEYANTLGQVNCRLTLELYKPLVSDPVSGAKLNGSGRYIPVGSKRGGVVLFRVDGLDVKAKALDEVMEAVRNVVERGVR